ncbi:MAG TPA: hypothetical protein VNX21_06765 [Candidatus Thermoplasmatota archaeon]|nr:hypothetical protein [Candidatus Thermoplasmatota archaeon]
MKAALWTLLLLAFVVTAPAEARHAGPCTHEYVEALRYGGPGAVVRTALACAERDACEALCDILP